MKERLVVDVGKKYFYYIKLLGILVSQQLLLDDMNLLTPRVEGKGWVKGDFDCSVTGYWENFVNREIEKIGKEVRLGREGEFHLKYFKFEVTQVEIQRDY